MALLDNLLDVGSLLDVGNLPVVGGLLGGGGDGSASAQTSDSVDLMIGADPSLSTDLSDVLDLQNATAVGDGLVSTQTDLTGIGGAAIDFSAPTFVGVSTTHDADINGSTGLT